MLSSVLMNTYPRTMVLYGCQRLICLIVYVNHITGWPSTPGLVWHCSVPCFTCPSCCFSVCFNGDHEASPGIECLSFDQLTVCYVLPSGLSPKQVSSFGRVMIQLRRTLFLFSSFCLLWLVTFPCLFRLDYQFTGGLLTSNITDHYHLPSYVWCDFHSSLPISPHLAQTAIALDCISLAMNIYWFLESKTHAKFLSANRVPHCHAHVVPMANHKLPKNQSVRYIYSK